MARPAAWVAAVWGRAVRPGYLGLQLFTLYRIGRCLDCDVHHSTV
jgi:hypothetical protein